MVSIISIIGCGILSFSYKILNIIFTRLDESAFVKKNYNYVWATLILITALIYSDSLLRQASFEFFNSGKVIGEILKTAIFACILGCISGYKTVNTKYDFDFCIIFPIFEEILFRGIILIILIKFGGLNEKYAVILSALLFGVMHFQYFGFNMGALRYVIFAFIGGYFFAHLVLETFSIIPSIFLHMVFNISAILFSKYRNKYDINHNVN